MSLMQRVCKSLGMLGVLLSLPTIAFSQSSYVPQAGEYAPVGNLPGDQTYPSVSLNTSGGLVVWQDNITDGDGLGISAVRLDNNFSASFATFRVNQQGAFDQEKPKVSLLNNGGAVFVWQGGKQGFQHIYARFLSANNTWTTGDIMVNATTNFYQIDPSVITLTNGNVVVVWSSFKQDGSMQGVYAQQFNPAGTKIGGEMPINQFTSYNQRTPAIAALSGGGFVIAWVSEQQRFAYDGTSLGMGTTAGSVSIYGRIYSSAGSPMGNEFLINTRSNICANPIIAASPDGGFLVVWGEKDVQVLDNSWDIYSRPFSAAGIGGVFRRVNTHVYGDQFGPKVSSVGTQYMVVWTSLAQDGSREGVFGQFLNTDGSPSGSEFRVNTTTVGGQIHPTVASDGASRFLAVFASFTGLGTSFDLFAQRYATYQQPLLPPGKPFVSAVSSSRLTVSWPPLSGFNISHYNLYIDGSATPTVVTNNMWTLNQLAPGSVHTFRLDYVLADGRRSPQSAVATGKTWGEDDNGDGLPDDWQAAYWGNNPANWPSPGAVLTPGGPTVLQAFQAGSDPLDPSTWFKAKAIVTSQGSFLIWNTQPGFVYQVMISTNMPPVWSNFGAPRFAAGTNDSVFLGAGKGGYYKVSRLRY